MINKIKAKLTGQILSEKVQEWFDNKDNEALIEKGFTGQDLEAMSPAGVSGYLYGLYMKDKVS